MTTSNRRDHLPVESFPAFPAKKLALSAEDLLPFISFSLVLLTALAFWQVGSCGFINFDDNSYVDGNSRVQQGITARSIIWAFTTGHASNWHPLTWISHMVDVQVFGLRPTWHHLMNLLFHIANTVLLFFVLHRMTKALWQSAFVAALFALHPLHVESVAWVAERKDVLSTFFWIIAIGAYASYVERPGLKRYLVVCGSFILGLLAKPMLVTLPFVLLLLDYWPLGRLERNPAGEDPAQTPIFRWATVRPLLVEKIPFFVLAAFSCVITYFVQYHGGAMQPAGKLPLAARLANALVSYAAYMGKMLWPVNLAVLYPHPGWWPAWKVLFALVLLAAITAAVMKGARRRPYLPVGWLWYVGTLIPVIGIVQVGSQAMADRYTYIPLIGLFIIAAWGIPGLLVRLPRRREVLASLASLCLICLFFLTWKQVSYWRSSITLYNHTLAITKRNGAIYMNRGIANWLGGNYGAALADLNNAIENSPWVALNYVNLGVVHNSLRDHMRAIAAFNKAAELDPGYAPIYLNRGMAYEAMGDYTRAIADFTKAVAINPGFAAAYGNRGATYGAMGDYTRAIADFNKAIEINPWNAAAHYNRGKAYESIGNHAGAIADFTKAVAINPGFAAAYDNRGAAYGAMGDHMRAIADFNKAIEINPRFAPAYRNRGLAFGFMGNHIRAIADFNKAIAIDPKYVAAYDNRGAAYGAIGNHAGAIADFTRAIEIDPKYAAAYRNRGVAYKATGNRVKAKADFTKAARLDPRYADHGAGTTGGRQAPHRKKHLTHR
ncbi:tetratricopeptide repeat protein [Syntrophorhabdus aromaticivorans]|uniref:tetratricopeptide repeat protein n=1 Tax=Syntrophorhabdus aromaticivorans TaxID=328301 RepID=UPI0003FB8DF9|nr:tetratricopeptide repeat protein [Syntrophorhabdus aromaticivorans]